MAYNSGVVPFGMQCYGAWYAHVPGLKVLCPYSAEDARGLLKAAIRDPDPVVFLENEILYAILFYLFFFFFFFPFQRTFVYYQVDGLFCNDFEKGLL
jgi:pyruvate/2-oxoglutarate/acetoin dehydrogenase E1 component